ncbi:MAG: hypothetical protein SFZ02_17370, partial [bacterium]|nr:hypothetical protein [bacterium]
MTTLLMICHVSITAQTPTLPTVIGYNWELPSWVTPSINSGFYGRPYDLPNNELPQAVSVELPWSALNPADD